MVRARGLFVVTVVRESSAGVSVVRVRVWMMRRSALGVSEVVWLLVSMMESLAVQNIWLSGVIVYVNSAVVGWNSEVLVEIVLDRVVS